MPKQRSLQLPTARAIDTWRDDETLFSLASRYHWVSCHSTAAQTCLALFGDQRHGSAHDLPSCLDHFVKQTGGMLGDAQQIVSQRTLLPFYLPYRSDRDAAEALAASRGKGVGALKARLGMLASRFRANHPLKACPECMLADAEASGAAHWRLRHQLPGVWLCPTHGTPLLQSNVKANGVGRFQWHLPSQSDLKVVAGLQSVPLVLGMRMGACAIETWLLAPSVHYDASRLVSTYRRAAAARHIISAAGRIDTCKLSTAILSVTTPLRSVPEFSALAQSATEASAQFSRILCRSEQPAHPLRHFVVLLALFDEWAVFRSAYENETDHPCDAGRDRSSPPAPFEMHISRKRSAVLKLLSEGKSVTAAARTADVAVATAMSWAAQSGMQIRRRPKMLKPEVRKQLITALKRGVDKKAIAAALNISIQTVTTTLRTEIGLSRRWHEARFAIAQRSARAAWNEALVEVDRGHSSTIRSAAPAAYAWLYRNDRAWLADQLRQRPSAPVVHHLRVDWDERDHALAQRVLDTGLADSESMRRTTIGTLCQFIPELRPLLGKLLRLPLTAAALQQVTARRRKAEKNALI